MNAEETVNPSPESASTADDECCTIRTAAEAVRRAKAELKKAQDFYLEVRKKAAERVEAVRKTTVGDVVDGTLSAVRKHPCAGLTLAAAAGYFLGRLFRR
jgi:ElaB/YqjD/DUF883 family membrane-anchored ribosome-binding protein